MSYCEVITYRNDGTRPEQHGLWSPVSIGRNYEMQFPAIWAPPSLEGMGRGGMGAQFTIRNAYPLCHNVLFVFLFSLSINYEMQFRAIWAPPAVEGMGRGGRNLQYGMPTLYVIMFCLCFNFPVQLFFYVAQLLIVYNKMKAENYGHQR
jgi:hypothetical protein